jgi:hypothetical protein
MGPHLLLRSDGRHGLFEEVHHGGRLRHDNGVTGRYLDHRRPSRLGHCAGLPGIIRSSVVSMYQLGLVRQPGSVTGPPLAAA